MQIDFHSDEFIQDPYGYYALLREQAPILYREDWGLWFVSRYADVNLLLRDKRLGRAILHKHSRESLGWQAPPAEHNPFYHMQDHSMMELEPPDHTRLKMLVQKAFTPRRVEALRPRVRQIAASLADDLPTAESVDLLETFAVPLSVTVIAELLGVPAADRAHLRPWSSAIVGMYELGGKDSEETAQRAVQAVVAFSDYLRGLIRSKQASPQDDLLSALAQVEAEGERLNEDELIATSILILNAGHEATVNVLGNGLYALFKHPDQLAMLKENPEHLPTAIEEMMRYDTPLPMFKRWVLEDFQYGGVDLKVGQEVALLFGSANRDPEQFEHPDQFDITRQHNPHLSFGAGIHYCLGAPLARVELQVAVEVLLRRFPDMSLADADVSYHPTFVFRGLTELPMVLSGGRSG